jgi:uncharacterized protein YbbK (DUF523 family)
MELMRVGISACLLGQEVRYDGGHKRDSFLMEMLSPRVEWVPVCPEVEMGLGTPREPLQLVRVGAATRMITIRTGIDHTDAMNAWAARRLETLAAEDLDGYVLKSASPSCGVEGVKIFSDAGRLRPTASAKASASPPELQRRRKPDATGTGGRGLFATALLARFPFLPVEEEVRLRDADLCEAFINRLVSYHRQKTLRLRSHV